MLGASAAIAVSGASRYSPLLANDVHGVPNWVAGPFGGISFHATAAQFYLLLAVMTAGYAGALAFGSTLRAHWVLGAVVALHVIFLLAPPLLSTDVFNYIDYGRLGAVHGLDPYTVTPSVAPHDPVYRFAHWRSTASAYGPLFTLATYGLVKLGLTGALWSLKLLAAAASLGCVALVWRIAARLGRPPLAAAAIFGLNPMLLVWTVAGAHNDLLMLVALLGALALVVASREASGGVALVAAVAVKASAGLAIPFVVLGARRRWRALAGVAAAAIVVLAVSALAFSDHAAGLIHVLVKERKLVAFDGVPNEVAHLFGLPGVTHAVSLVSGALLLAAIAWLLVRVLRGGDWVSACGWALLALVTASAWFLAWYTIWPLAFAALVRDRRLLVATLAIQLYFVVNHLPLFPR